MTVRVKRLRPTGCILTQSDKFTTRAARRSKTVPHLMPTDFIAGIDIGGTKIAAAVADAEGHIVSRTRFRTRTEAGPHVVVEDAAREIERMAAEAGARLGAIS